MYIVFSKREIDFLSDLLKETGADEIIYHAREDNLIDAYTLCWTKNGIESRSTFDRGLIVIYNYNAFRFACEVI